MVERGLETERADRGTEAPAEMAEPLHEVGREPEVVRAELAVVLPLAERRVGEGLADGVHELVLLQLVVEPDEVEERPRVLEPERVVGDRLDLVRGFQHPALAPHVHDPVALGVVRDEVERQLEHDCVHVLARLRVDAAVDEAEVALLVLGEAVAVPGQRPGRQVLLHAAAEHRVLGIEVEEVVPLELEERLRDRQLAQVGHGVRHVVELRRVVDRAEEARQVVEERVVAAAEEELDRMPARRLRLDHLVQLDDRREAAAREVREVDLRAALLVRTCADLRHAELAEVLVLDSGGVVEERVERPVSRVARDPRVRGELEPVEHVGVEDPRLRDGCEGQRDDDAPLGRVARVAEHVVDVGGADVDVGENRVDGVRVVVVGHRGPPRSQVGRFGARRAGSADGRRGGLSSAGQALPR